MSFAILLSTKGVGHYWTSNSTPSGNDAEGLTIWWESITIKIINHDRCEGLQIRPVFSW